MTVDGSRVVITAGASGIGLAIARQLADCGCQIVLADVDAAALTICADERGSFHTFVCDVTQQGALEALAEFSWATLGGVDLVFANEGVGLPLRPLLDQTEAHARWVMEVNYFGAWHTLQTFGPRLIEQGSQCHVVVTGSENSIAVPAPLLGAYNASKHAVLGLTETFDRETPDFLGVSLLCPALVATNIAASVARIPDEFGGPETFSGGGPALGFSPEHVAEHAISGVEAGDFYIFTHNCNRNMISERLSAQLNAIDRQTQPGDVSDACNTRSLLGRLFDQIVA